MKTIIDELNFLKKTNIIQWKIRRKQINYCLLTTKLIEKIPDAANSKQYYQTYLKNKNKKSVKQSKIITEEPKNLGTQAFLTQH